MASSQSAEERKRKHIAAGIDRMKANHMSRQLQLRLQYARLKVDNGWQQQNLNEVENLYFHNSQQRLTKTSSEMVDGSVPQMFVPMNPPSVTGPIPTFRSFKFRPNITPDMDPFSRNTSFQSKASEQSTSRVLNASVPSSLEPLVSSVAPESTKSKDSDRSMPTTSKPSVAAQTPSESPYLPFSTSTNAVTPNNIHLATDSSSITSMHPPSQTSHNPYSSHTSTQAPSTKLISQLYPYGAPALTYDSFWSSHTVTNSQKGQKSALGVADRSPSIQTVGESTAAINTNRSFANLPELPAAPSYPAAGDRREQGSPA